MSFVWYCGRHAVHFLSLLYSWNEVYEKELAEFQETGDEGEIWLVMECKLKCKKKDCMR